MADIIELFRAVSAAIAAEFTVVRQIPHKGESGRATEDVLLFLLMLMNRARVLLEHRIRARSRQIMVIRQTAHGPAAAAIPAIVDAAGAEPYFGDFTPYF